MQVGDNEGDSDLSSRKLWTRVVVDDRLRGPEDEGQRNGRST